MDGIRTGLNNETIYLDKKSPAHFERNKLIKGNLNFNNLNFKNFSIWEGFLQMVNLKYRPEIDGLRAIAVL